MTALLVRGQDREPGVGRPRRRRGCAVDDRGLVTRPLLASPVSVAFDGRVVWSFRPERDGRVVRGRRVTPWPDVLRPFLDGVVEVALTEGVSGRTLFSGQVRFGSADTRVRVCDRAGRPLMVNKVGTLSRAFGESGEAVRQEVLAGTARLLEVLRHDAGVPAFLAYGALLGAVREGRTIGHDCDVDLVYLSDQPTPVDVILESYRVERATREAGWQTLRMSGADFKVVLPLLDGRRELVDVFAGFSVGETYYQLGNRSGRLDRSAILPTGSVRLEGVDLPAPRRQEAMLEFLYGPGWRTPDPAFRFDDPPDGVRRLDGWLRGFRTEQPRWNAFFRSPDAARIPASGSDFASWVASRVGPGVALADLGCGDGRDAVELALRGGRRVVAYDGAPEARAHAVRRVRRSGADVEVRRLVLNEYRTVTVTLAELAREGVRHLYARHLVDCVDPTARRNLWRLARSLLAGGGRLFLEFSSEPPDPHPSRGRLPAPQPAGLVHRVPADEVVSGLSDHGARVLHREDGPGLDMFDEPDPWVTRLEVTFSGGTDA
jgi:SAM-dependent methyltransferase